jgi:hypothetical protein
MDAEVLARLDAETATVRTELGRSETKAGHLLTTALGGLTALVAIGPSRHLPPAGVVLGVAGTVADVASVVLLGLVLFPRLGRRRAGWLAHTRRTAQQILRHAAGGNPEAERAEQLAALSRLAAWKFRLIQLAEVALGLAVLLVLAAAVV